MARQRDRSVPPLLSIPFQTLQNPYAPFEVLTENQVEGIHKASMRILEEIGMEFLDEETLDIWKSAGAIVDRESQRVRIERELVEEALKTVPSSFTLRPTVSDRQNYQTWVGHGEKDALYRAYELADQLLESYEQPALDSNVQGELMQYVEKGKQKSTVSYF